MFLLGFTVEGFDQAGGTDVVVEVDDDDMEDDDVGGEHDKLDGESPNADQTENQSDGDQAIDELDKENLNTRKKSGSTSKRVAEAVSHAAMFSDSDQENFILKCAVSKTCPTPAPSSDDMHVAFVSQSDDTVPKTPVASNTSLEGVSQNMNVSVGVCTPLITREDMLSDSNKSKNLDYCDALLNSIDFVESDDDNLVEEELGVLPPLSIQVLQSNTLKRPLLESLDQVNEKETMLPKNTTWGPVLSQKPLTGNHGNVNIIEKDVAYKRKQNLEIPPTFKGKSCFLSWSSCQN